MRPTDFFLAVEFDRKREEERMKAMAEITRGAVVRLMNMFLKSPVSDISRIWSFPWDESKDIKLKKENLLTLEEISKKIYGTQSELEG